VSENCGYQINNSHFDSDNHCVGSWRRCWYLSLLYYYCYWTRFASLTRPIIDQEKTAYRPRHFQIITILGSPFGPHPNPCLSPPDLWLHVSYFDVASFIKVSHRIAHRISCQATHRTYRLPIVPCQFTKFSHNFTLNKSEINDWLLLPDLYPSLNPETTMVFVSLSGDDILG
jgi:hypothetical protein